jgi:hypothetical protein
MTGNEMRDAAHAISVVIHVCRALKVDEPAPGPKKGTP